MKNSSNILLSYCALIISRHKSNTKSNIYIPVTIHFNTLNGHIIKLVRISHKSKSRK